MIGKKTI